MKHDIIIEELIDIMLDLNKSISVHVDNHSNKVVDKSIQLVAGRISKKLIAIREELKTNNENTFG